MAGRHPIKVGFISPGLKLGGAELWIYLLARFFDACVPVGVAITNGVSPLIARRLQKYCPIFSRNVYPYVCRAANPWKEVFDRSDIVLAWGQPLLPNVTGISEEELRKKVVFVSHSASDRGALLVKHASQWSLAIVAVSRFSRNQMDHDLQARCEVIWNGADVERSLPRGKQDLWHVKDRIRGRKVALYVGRLTPDKGAWQIMMLSKALPPSWVLMAVGDVLIDSPDLDRIVVVPPVWHIGDYLGMADALVSLSPCEAFPLTWIEAWQAGVPVVCCRTGPVEELEEEFGPMVSCVTSLTSTDEVVHYLQCRRRDDNITSRARNVALEYLTASRMAERWERYLERLMDR